MMVSDPVNQPNPDPLVVDRIYIHCLLKIVDTFYYIIDFKVTGRLYSGGVNLKTE